MKVVKTFLQLPAVSALVEVLLFDLASKLYPLL
jgi:hypothetical protein